jgi:ACS family hexuronate transporter-like MFS transporter
VFCLAAALNYLDRQLLSAFAVTIRNEFSLSAAEFGLILSAHSLPYALAAPIAGLLIDRVGLNSGSMIQVALWSATGLSTVWAGGYAGLLGVRAMLGLAESGAIPAGAKAGALYLPPGERTFGAAFNQVGIALGLVAAPLLAGYFTTHYGWRMAFFVAGALGFLWLPLWWVTSRAIPPTITPTAAPASAREIYLDRAAWGLAAGNILAMTPYSLWINWTTLFLVRTYGLSEQQANVGFVWLPPLFGTLGGFAGSAMALWLARRRTPLDARLITCRWSAAALLLTALAPFVGNPWLATAIAAWSFFWAVAFSSNTYAIPVDYFGPQRAATSVAMMTASYGLMQTVVSPAIGAVVDAAGFGPVCLLIALLPAVAIGIVEATRKAAGAVQ